MGSVCTESVPTPPPVLTNPLVVKLERVAMFCEVFTVTAPPVYVRPVEYVVVAAAYTLPFASTPRPEPESPVNHWFVVVMPVVEACSNCEVEEAKREKGEPVSLSAVPVAEVTWPQKVGCVKAS
jgi:hypothetical protein